MYGLALPDSVLQKLYYKNALKLFPAIDKTLFNFWTMILVNTPTITNKAIVETLGIARGSTVRARNVGQDIFAGLKNIIGGEISEYTKLQAQSREQALQRMIEDAEKMGANAIVNVRLTTSMVMQGCSEILAYGTAVIIKWLSF